MKTSKNIIKTLLFSFCFFAINAYENSFFNNTDIPIGIAIQYTGNDSIEPLYKKLAKPGSLISFIPGKKEGLDFDKKLIPAIKWGFCLDNIYYVENPTSQQTVDNFKNTRWQKIPITWTEEESITKKVENRLSKNPKKLRNSKIKKINHLLEKSLCRDRHFDIMRNEHGKIVIISSLKD